MKPAPWDIERPVGPLTPSYLLRCAVYWRAEARECSTEGARKVARAYMRYDALLWRRRRVKI